MSKLVGQENGTFNDYEQHKEDLRQLDPNRYGLIGAVSQYMTHQAPPQNIKSSLHNPNSIIYAHKMSVYKMFDPIFSHQEARMRREKLAS